MTNERRGADVGARVVLLRMARKRGGMTFFFAFLTVIAFGAFFPAFAPLPAVSQLSSTPIRLQNRVNARQFDISSDMFWKDGNQFQIIGGDLHYFRVLPEYWKDRLLRAKALGLNTIQTYVPWNLHEPRAGEWIFEGIADIESFLRLCQELGFLVMLRAGPYICGEWDLGGFPAWLLAIEPPLRLRSSDPAFLQLVDKWWSVLLPKIAPLLYHNGGPIVMVQIENEYGSYGEDKNYLRYLVTLARTHLGDDIILYTTDGGSRETLEKGTIRGSDVFSAVDFTTGDNPWPIFELQKEFNAPGRSPPLSAEFYTGWLTHWGEKLATTDANFIASSLETILSRNGSAVLYMAHGGTNFGFFNGANTGVDDSDYKPDLTSYDYDAPIKESGDVENSKFRALRGVIQRYSSLSLPPIPSNNGRKGYGHIKVGKVASLFDVLDATHMIKSKNPLPMESAGQMFGFLMYVAEYPVKENGSILSIVKLRDQYVDVLLTNDKMNEFSSTVPLPRLFSSIHDRAQVFVSCPSNNDGKSPKYIGTIERWSNKALDLPYIECASNISLFVLVENMGRVNYGPYLYDRKGILSTVFVDRNILYEWKMFPIPLNNLSRLLKVNDIVQVRDHRTTKALLKKLKIQSKMTSKEPEFYEGRFSIDTLNEVKDTYLSLNGWSKGIAFVNGFNMGRFWPSHGPQCNLYVPGPVLQRGENVVVILELEAPNPELVVTSVDQPNYTCGSKVHQL